MAISAYPGYEIERFEDEGGRCYVRLTKSSVDKQEANDARETEVQEHQKREAIRKAEE